MKEKIRLMIADDSSIIRKLIQKDLKNFEIEIVGEASNGQQAVDMFKELRPNVVTMDIIMPEMDGLTVIEELLKIDPAVKIMVISALSDKATGIEAIKKGARGFLLKPFTTEKLVKEFTKLIEK